PFFPGLTMQNRNVVLFLVFSTLLLVGWLALLHFVQPPKPADQGPAAQVNDNKDKDKPPEKKDRTPEDNGPEQPTAKPAPPLEAVVEEPEAKPHAPITLGNPKDDFFTAVLDSRGASVTSLTMRDFQAADKDGRPVKNADGTPKPLELIRPEANRDDGSFLL